jgi:hypothetical protein
MLVQPRLLASASARGFATAIQPGTVSPMRGLGAGVTPTPYFRTGEVPFYPRQGKSRAVVRSDVAVLTACRSQYRVA